MRYCSLRTLSLLVPLSVACPGPEGDHMDLSPKLDLSPEPDLMPCAPIDKLVYLSLTAYVGESLYQNPDGKPRDNQYYAYADELCSQTTGSMVLPEFTGKHWRAWLSLYNGSMAASAPTRILEGIDKSKKECYRWHQLTINHQMMPTFYGYSSLLHQPQQGIRYTEQGVDFNNQNGASVRVWTGTLANGNPDLNGLCMNNRNQPWSPPVLGDMGNRQGMYGASGFLENWTNASNQMGALARQPCTSQAHLYCFEVDNPDY